MKDKSSSLADKMNRLTASLDLAEEMTLVGDDIVEFVNEKTDNTAVHVDTAPPTSDVLCLTNLIDDFKFVRETLKENTLNGRRVLNAVTLDLLDNDDDKRALLITSFAELNKAVAENMKLYINSYKDISNIMVNLKKIEDVNPHTINNTLNINTTEAVSTMDLIKSIAKKEKQ